MTTLRGVFVAQDCLDVVAEYAASSLRQMLGLRAVCGAFEHAVRNTVNYRLRGDDAAESATVVHLSSRRKAVAKAFGVASPEMSDGLRFTPEALAELARIERLLLLSIQTDVVIRVTVHDATTEHMRFIREVEQLAALDLSLSPSLTDAALVDTFLSEADDPRRAALARLDLAGCFALTDACLGAIATKLPRLQLLRLAGVNGITAGGIRQLAPLAATLVTFDVAGVTTFGDDALAAVADTFRALMVLDVAFTGVTADGMLTTIARPACAAQALQQVRVHPDAAPPRVVATSTRMKRIVRVVATPSHPTLPGLPPPEDPPHYPKHVAALLASRAGTVSASRAQQLGQRAAGWAQSVRSATGALAPKRKTNPSK